MFAVIYKFPLSNQDLNLCLRAAGLLSLNKFNLAGILLDRDCINQQLIISLLPMPCGRRKRDGKRPLITARHE